MKHEWIESPLFMCWLTEHNLIFIPGSNLELSIWFTGVVILTTKQATSSMVTLLHYHRKPSTSEQFRNGLLCSRPFRNVMLRRIEHRMCPMENEQDSWNHHVSILFRVCCCFSWIWIRYHYLSGLSFVHFGAHLESKHLVLCEILSYLSSHKTYSGIIHHIWLYCRSIQSTLLPGDSNYQALNCWFIF